MREGINQDIQSLPYWKNQEPPKYGQDYTDPLFPPNKNSLLGLDSSGNPIDPKTYEAKSKSIDSDKIGFFRPKEIFGDDYYLFTDKIEVDDIKQGGLGDCYFMTPIANLCKFPNIIKNMFLQSTKNENGFYEIKFYIDGRRQIVIIDDYIPAYKSNKKPCFAKPNENEIWVLLLEKAWAKINGGYANIISGSPCDSFEFLIGRGSSIYDLDCKKEEDLEDYKYEIIKNVQLADQNNCLISAITKDSKSVGDSGIEGTHAYSILNFIKIETSEGKEVYLFRMRNPWSHYEWKGDWSDKSPLWDSKTKSQVHFSEKDDGIFYMNDSDFFKYFTEIEICYLFFDSKEVIYEIEGENLKNGSVFIIETEEEGYLTISVPREHWRTHRNLRDKVLPTHITLVKYDPYSENRLKNFSNYKCVFDCTLNERIPKGKYLIYIYRDFEHARYEAEKKMIVKITCSARFRYAQMNYDERDKGFPLLQNIILQLAFQESNYDPDSGEDFSFYKNDIKGNKIGVFIKYISTPGYFYECTGDTNELKDYIMLTPYLDSNTTTLKRVIPSGKYLVLMGLRNGYGATYHFDLTIKSSRTNKAMIPQFDDNDIDLSLYTDFRNDIKVSHFREMKTQSLEKAKEYHDENYGKVRYTSLEELNNKYGPYMKLLDDIKVKNENKNLKWGIIKTDYDIYIGQFNGEMREGKGLYIGQNNVFTGYFENDEQNGKGYTYNKNLEKLFYCIYVNGRIGRTVSVEEELTRIEKEKLLEQEKMKKEQEIIKKNKEEKEALLKKKEKELILFLIKGTGQKDKVLQETVEKNFQLMKKETMSEEREKSQKAQSSKEAKEELEELKNQIKLLKEKEQKMEIDIAKKNEEINNASKEIERLNEIKRKRELERQERDNKDEYCGVKIQCPKYLRNRVRRHQSSDLIESEMEDDGRCVLCSCNIF